MSPFLTTLGAGSARGFGRARLTVLGPTSAPSSVSTTANSSTQITISWTNGDALAQTQLYRDGVLIATLAAGVTTTTSTGLSAYSSYSFFVRHIKDAITSVNSNTSSATTSPAAPSSLSVSSQGSVSSIVLNWTNGDAAAQTEIYRSGVLIATVSASIDVYNSSSLSADTSYSYYVRHTRGGLTSTNSNTASAYTYPSAPYSFSATAASKSQINLTWTNAHSLSTQIFRNGSLLTTVSAGVTSYQSTGLSASTLYSYEIIHNNSTSGYSSDASAASATTLEQITGTVTYTAGNYGENTYTFTVPSGITQITCTLVGQGGGGAGGQGSIASGGGGGGAGAIVDRVVSVSPGSNLTVGINFAYNSATGGNGGQAANDNAADGGNASLQFSGGTLIAYGGSRGRSSSGGAGGAGGGTSTPVGSGGSTSNGSSGQAGVFSSRGGNGGSSYFGSGGTGASFGSTGGSGSGDGAGGGGAYASYTYAHSGQGGNGGNAKVIISYSN